MNILWLDEACRHNRFDDWLHWKFAKEIGKHANIFFYAPHIHEKEPDFTPIPYNRNILLEDIVRDLKIDAVILDTKASAYHNYLPDSIYHDKHVGHIYWIPRDFKTCKVTKICIEEDFQYETTYDWYEEHNFKAILQKHLIHVNKYKSSIPIYPFPFSVDTNVFKPSSIHRKTHVGFAGTMGCGNALSGGSVYKPRELAYNALHTAGLLGIKTTPAGNRIEFDDYVKYLNEYSAYLSCGSMFNLSPAKMFEIIGSGGILITNKTYGLKDLFPDNSYITYEEDVNGLIENVTELFRDSARRDLMVKIGLECIREKHSHEVRIKQLLDIIKAVQ